jgi:DNA-binding transcriptional LysR family regulator
MELDLHSIRIVRAVAEHGTISGAARALGYSQPAISQHLRRAEARLGVPLVARAGRGVRLTEPGVLLARHAIAITSALDAASGDLAELMGLAAGTVRVGGFPTASSTIVPRLLQAMRTQHQGITMNFVEAEPPEAIGMLRDGLLDIAITFAYPGDRADPHRDDSSLDTVPLFTEPVVLAMPESHPLAKQQRVELEQLAGERWIAGCPLCRGHLLAACDAVGFAPRIELETDNAVAVLNLVAADLGLALLPRLALATAVVPPGATIRETLPTSDRSIRMVTQAGASRVPSIAAALATIRALDGAEWGLARA